ncbi:MAG: metal-dependent transcriptional regulator [Candidatus Omnitrophica bacterium]|nr:metal-dependent transcriptional regulator [Candidatus Omnitrophota bacterium]
MLQHNPRALGENPIPSESVENYLKAIYEIEEETGRVNTSSLAELLSVSAPSVTAMVKRLSQEDPPLVNHESHQGVTLTQHGRERALEIIRHHRLLETFLCTVLDYSWDEVHEEAERLEHYISEKLEDRIAKHLGYPKYDPHGAPIPTKDGQIPEIQYLPLSALESGQSAVVLRVKHDRPDLLRYLASLGIQPNETVTVTEKAPFDGPVHVRVGTQVDQPPQAIGPGVADLVLVRVK